MTDGVQTNDAVPDDAVCDDDLDALKRRVEAMPWPTLLIDPQGIVAAYSAPACTLADLGSGASIAALEHVATDASAVVGIAAGWRSVNVYRPSRAAILAGVIHTLRERMRSLLRATSLQQICQQLAEFLPASGIGFTVHAFATNDAQPRIVFSAPELVDMLLPTSYLQIGLNARAPMLLDAAAIEHSDRCAVAMGVRGHLLMPLSEGDPPKYLLHLWGGMISPETFAEIEGCALDIGALIAQVSERERLMRRLQRRDALSAAAQVIASIGLVDDVLREICRQAQMLLESDQASVYLPDDGKTHLICAMTTGLEARLLGTLLPLTGSLAGRAFREGSTLAFADVEREPDMYRPVWETHRLRSALFQPLRHQGVVIGILSVACRQQRVFSADDRMMVRRFAELAAAAVANARLHTALHQSERRYRLLFERAEELVFSLSPDGVIRRCNSAAIAVTGIDGSMLVGMSLYDLMRPADASDLRERFAALLQNKRFPRPWTFEIHGEQGDPIVLEATSQVVWAGAQPAEIDLICRDVTARRIAAYELQRRQMELTTLLRVSQALSRSLDLTQTLGAALETIELAGLGLTAAVLLRDDEGRLRLRASHNLPPQMIQLIEQHSATPLEGEARALSGGTPVVIDTETMRRERATMLDIADQRLGPLVVAPILVEGAAVGLLEFTVVERGFDARDIQLAEAIAAQMAQAITNARIAQELRETSSMNARLYREAEAMRAYLDAIIQNTPDVLVVCRPDLSMQPLNQEPLTALGYERQVLAGHSLLQLVPPDRQGELTRYWFLARKGESQRFEIDLLSGDGGQFNALVSLDLIPDYDEVLVVIKDVTERHRLEARLRQNEKLAALGRLVAGAAHELNNPLAVILGLSQLQLNESLPTAVHADIEQIERAARRAASIVQQLRIFGQPASSDPEPLDLALIVGEIVRRLSAEIAAQHVHVTLDLPVGMPHVAGSLHQIEQVVFNIARNAVQALAFCPPGAPRQLRFRAAIQASSVVLVIEDTGAGIAPEHVPHIFEPFFTTREVGQGMGMGLAVVYSIVQQHGGEVWVESRQGEGTAFSVRLPIAPEQAAAPPQQVVVVPTGLAVLLVEDDALVRSMAQRALRRLEWRVDAVGRAEDAFLRALTNDYALIITDLHMPGMDGVELYERLHTLRPALRWLVLTGDTMGERSSAFLARANLPVLHKPFTYDQLVASVSESLQTA